MNCRTKPAWSVGRLYSNSTANAAGVFVEVLPDHITVFPGKDFDANVAVTVVPAIERLRLTILIFWRRFGK